MFAHETITIGRAVIVCGFSLAIVFLVLLAISYMIDLVHWLLTKGQKKPAAPAASAVPAPAAPTAPAKKNTSADAVLIAAAIAAYLGAAPDQLIVRSIRRVSGEETPWVQTSRTGSMQ